MSVRVMAQVWELDLTPTEKLVLLALADCANDEGDCWPSIATLARKAGVGERSVQRSIQAMKEAGHLSRAEVIGKGCKYRIHPRHAGTPATESPPPQCRRTPATVAPKPSRTINQKPKGAHELPENWLPRPFTAGTKSRATVDGWPPGEAEHQLEHFAAHHRARRSRFDDWQAAWATWVLNNKRFGRQANGTSNRTTGNQGRSSLARAIDEGIDFLDSSQAQVS